MYTHRNIIEKLKLQFEINTDENAFIAFKMELRVAIFNFDKMYSY